MKIAIVGAGAMGCMFGGLLSRSGHEVWLVLRRETDAQVINERGVILCAGGTEEIMRPKATASPTEVGVVDLVVFLVRSFDTAAAARQARPMVGPNTYAMTLQNGLGNVEAIMSELGMDRVIYGVTFAGGSLKGPGYVEVDALALSHVPTRIGEWNGGQSPTLLEVCQAFDAAGIPTEITDEPQQLLWRTIAQKSATMMVTGLTKLRVGDLLELDEGRELVAMAIAEVLEVARLKGIEGLEGSFEHAVAASTETSRGHITSLLAAILAGKRTEVGSLGEAVVREAEQQGLSAPVNQTLSLLIKIVEKTYDRTANN